MFIVNQFGRFSAAKAEAQFEGKAHQFILYFITIHLYGMHLNDRFSHSYRYTCWIHTVEFANGITCVFDFDGNTKRQFELTDCCLFTTSALYTVDLWNGFLFISACVTFFLLYDQVCAVAYIFITLSWFVFVISKHYTARSIESATKPSTKQKKTKSNQNKDKEIHTYIKRPSMIK